MRLNVIESASDVEAYPCYRECQKGGPIPETVLPTQFIKFVEKVQELGMRNVRPRSILVDGVTIYVRKDRQVGHYRVSFFRRRWWQIHKRHLRNLHVVIPACMGSRLKVHGSEWQMRVQGHCAAGIARFHEFVSQHLPELHLSIVSGALPW